MRWTAPLVLAFTALLTAPLAKADPGITLVWEGTTGSGTLGTDTMAAGVGDFVTLQVYVDPDANGLSFVSLSFDYDPSVLAVTAHVECPDASSTPPGGNLIPSLCFDTFFRSLAPIELGMIDDPVGGTLGSADAANFGGPGTEALATIELAAIEFLVLSAADTGIDVSYLAGLDSANDANGDLFFPASSATLLPEPGVPLALAAGALLLCLLGRRRSRREGRRMSLLALALVVIASGATAQDMDGDGILDPDDNCLLVPNAGPLFCDTDMDGYGNACDADYENSGTQGNLTDGAIFGLNYGLSPGDLNPDHNCDGIVGGPDFGVFFPNVGAAVGPSGLACAGTTPCPP